MKKLFSFVCALVCAMSLSAKEFYLIPNSNWLEANARFAIYAYNETGGAKVETWVGMTAVESATVTYHATVDDAYTTLIFCRMNPATSENNWNNIWNQTKDLPLSEAGDNNCYTIAADAWSKGSGTWSKYVYVEDVYTVAGAATLFGSEWSASDTTNDMVKQEDGTYKWEKKNVTLSAGDYTYKVVVNHNWNPELMGDQIITVATSGQQDITITYDASTKKANATVTLVKEEVVVPKIQVAGSFFELVGGKWDIKDLTPAEDKLTASIKVTMEKGDYEFKMVKAGTWYGCNGTMTRDNCKDFGFYSGDSNGNAKLTADAAGEYTFTWTYEGDKLTVTFPAATATDLIGADSDSKAVKMVRDGQLLIVRDGVTYNMMGSVVK